MAWIVFAFILLFFVFVLALGAMFSRYRKFGGVLGIVLSLFLLLRPIGAIAGFVIGRCYQMDAIEAVELRALKADSLPPLPPGFHLDTSVPSVGGWMNPAGLVIGWSLGAITDIVAGTLFALAFGWEEFNARAQSRRKYKKF